MTIRKGGDRGLFGSVMICPLNLDMLLFFKEKKANIQTHTGACTHTHTHTHRAMILIANKKGRVVDKYHIRSIA